MRNTWKSVVCLGMTAIMLLTDTPAYIYAAKNAGELTTIGASGVAAEASEDVRGS